MRKLAIMRKLASYLDRFFRQDVKHSAFGKRNTVKTTRTSSIDQTRFE